MPKIEEKRFLNQNLMEFKHYPQDPNNSFFFITYNIFCLDIQ